MTLGIGERIDDRQRREAQFRGLEANGQSDERLHRTVVRPGDTLWSVAAREYGDGSLWPILVEHNPEAVDEQGRLRESGRSTWLVVPHLEEARHIGGPQGGGGPIAEIAPETDPFIFNPWVQPSNVASGGGTRSVELARPSPAPTAEALEGAYQLLVDRLGHRNSWSADRVFGSGEHALRNFTETIPDLADFRRVAASYGLETRELLAIFLQEGGLRDQPYRPGPSSSNQGDRFTQVAWHLWSAHGMDGFAAVYRKRRGGRDNTFADRGNHRAQIHRQLTELHRLNLLWNEDGVRTANPAEQLSPERIMAELAGAINAEGMPTPRFRQLAYRIVAAVVSRYTLPIQRHRTELAALGYEAAAVDQFRHNTFDRALEDLSANPTSAAARQTFDRIVESAHNSRMPVAVARFAMGTYAGYLAALRQVRGDFSRWSNDQNQATRVATTEWALALKAALMARNDENGQDLLEQVAGSVTREALPSGRVRRALRRALRDLGARRDFDGLERIMDFVIDASNRYASMETVQDWIVALSRPRPDRRGIPDRLYSRLVPSSNLAPQIRRSITRYGALEAFAAELMRQREGQSTRER